MNSRMLIVTGPESSGTRLVQTILSRTTGFMVDDETTERWWQGEPLRLTGSCGRVTRRSLPHGAVRGKREFHNITGFALSAQSAGYKVSIVATTRDRICSAMSKTNIHTHNEWDSCKEMEIAASILGDIFNSGLHVVVCSYEALMLVRQDYANYLVRQLGFDSNAATPKLVDGNVKYMKRNPWKTKTQGEQTAVAR